MNRDIIDSLPKLSQTRIFSSMVDSGYGMILSKIRSSFKGNILYVARDDLRLNVIKDDLNFYDPNINTINLPSWDLLPYDRTSPNTRITSIRTNALSQMLNNSGDHLILTSAANLIQKLPPKDIFSDSCLDLKKNDKISRDNLIEFLLRTGFNRSASANEAGEFAVRGSIIDVISSESEHGYRLDFFGDILDSIKLFDPLTQISGQMTDKFTILPASEIILTAKSRSLFCDNFRKIFGAKSCNDPLYQAISDGRKYGSMENWLPLFYEKLDSIFDYIDFDLIIFDYLTKQSITERQKTIEDHYQARLDSINNKLENTYYPVHPDSLWLNNLGEKLANKALIEFHNFHQELGDAISFDMKRSTDFASQASKSKEDPILLLKQFQVQHPKLKIMIACLSQGSLEHIRKILQNHNSHIIEVADFAYTSKIKGKTIGLAVKSMESGFIYGDLAIISEQDLFGAKAIVRTSARKTVANFLKEASHLTEGELVVHNDHGIGRFAGLETITVLGIDHDCLLIIYDKGDKLFIPVENIEVLTRYGSDTGVLDKLGSINWQQRKATLKSRIKIAAAALINIAAERALKKAPIITYSKPLYEEFCARFEYFETDDQLNAIMDVQQDLISDKPMDRLICGDVGFGKTEVALRAAFMSIFTEEDYGIPKAVGELDSILSGERAECTEKYMSTRDHDKIENQFFKCEGYIRNQVAVIVPTTLLARQHYKNFTKRFEGFNVSIRLLSRMVSAKEAKITKEGIKNGEVDIVIGTHALLAKDIDFKNLALLIVDEEQNFGVGQKERLKELKNNLHVLTLSATPIPRTLQMSLAGIKDLSLIATPPVDRLAVRTSVMDFDPLIIREAILREHYRGGKSFYVCPHISDIEKILPKLKKLVPEIRMVMAHGQMPAASLDQIMNDFYDGKYDLLLSTSIVESGLDIAQANTIIIDHADKFGLSQLYQLRGRVGRGKIRAYAYLLTKQDKLLSKTAMKRLEVMQTLDTLGAGFTVASHDMDIRGFGNLVGDEQSGHIREVGVELYQKMLSDAVSALMAKNQDHELPEESYNIQINLGLSVLIPKDYIEDLSLRLSFYQRIANLKDQTEIDNITIELIDRFGSIPFELKNLLEIISLKQLCKKLSINKIDAGSKAVVIGFHQNQPINLESLLSYITKSPDRFRLRPDGKLVLNIVTEDAMKRLSQIKINIENITKAIFEL